MQVLPIRTGSDGNLYILTTNNDTKFLIECGLKKLDIMKILTRLKISISDFEGCFISHFHKDHCESIEWVSKYMPVFVNQQVKEKYKNVINVNKLPSNKPYRLKDLKILPFNLEHGDAENYGYMFRDDVDTILFATDFRECFSNIFNNIFNEVYLECNWNKELIQDYVNEIKENRQINTHCSLEITSAFIKRLKLDKCRKIVLIHPSKDYCDKDLCLERLRNENPNMPISFAENLI